MQAGPFCVVRSLPDDIQRLMTKLSQTVLTDGVVIGERGCQVHRCACLSAAVASC